MNVAILIPAAGLGTRMRGADKLLQTVDGMPLLRRVALRARNAARLVLVTVPELTGARAEVLRGLDVQIVSVPDNTTGMAASLRRGGAEVPRDHAVLILPADMPDITFDDLCCVINAFTADPRKSLQQGETEDGRPGHPVLFPPDCLPAFESLSGDEGARTILMANIHRLNRVPLPGRNAVLDLDTPEAWAEWRSTRGNPH